MADQKNKRTALSVQDVINGHSTKSQSRFKSGYSGPKKAPKSMGAPQATGSIPPTAPAMSAAMRKSGGILDYAWIAYCVILAIGLTSATIAYTAGSGRGDGIYYPNNVITISGVVKDIFADYRNGGLGSGYNAASAGSQEAGASSGEAPDNTENGDTNALLGETATVTTPNSTTGATMALDTGSAQGSYSSATSHEELLTQLDKALAANEPDFVGTKLAYEDAQSGALIGYPQSVVEHFTKYMSDNSDKRAAFIEQIKDPGEYSAKNEAAYIVKLPLLQFTINMGYDGTTISISGFSDQQMDSGQSAVVSPLLPCMYTIHAQTAKGSQTSEVECNMNEGNLKINIGVTN